MAEGVTGTVTLTPQAGAFSTLKTEIARYALLPDDAEALAVAADGIKRAINVLNMNEWNVQRKHTDITTVTNQKEYDLPADFLKPIYCETLSATTNEPIGRLDYMDWSSFDFAYTDRSALSGTPLNFSVYNLAENAKLTLSANPSSSWTTTNPKLRLRYYASFAYPSLSTDVVSAVSAVELFLTWSAKSYIAKHYMNKDKQDIADSEAQNALQMLNRWDNGLTGGR